MSNITFLAGSFYPDFEAVGFCAYQVQKCLADEHLISVVSFRSQPHQQDEETICGIRIIRFATQEMTQRSLLAKHAGRIASMRLKIMRIRGALRKLLSPTSINKHLVQSYIECLEKLEPKPDVLVPLVFPFETVLAALAYKAKNPHVTLVPYLFDDFVQSGSLHVLNLAREMKRNRHLDLERRMLSESDAVLAMHPLRQHLEENFESCLLGRVTFVEHPLLSPPVSASEIDNLGTIKLCFTGSLIRNVREAGNLIRLLEAVQIEKPVRVDFYVMGNAAQDVPSGFLSNGVEIVNHGRVTKSEADAAVARADILINIGEVTGRQVSSKIFEYVSTGKPILHLANVKTDSVSGILSKYPLGLSIINDQRKLRENAHKISDLIRKGESEKITFDVVQTIWPDALPEYTAKIFRKIINMREDL
jgi:hypothetical protein